MGTMAGPTSWKDVRTTSPDARKTISRAAQIIRISRIAYGSNMQSNAWHVDGLEASAPETGTAWVYTNPAMIEEIQVLGVGARAESGNMLGAAFNVVTKSGTNKFKGTFDAYYQGDALTDSHSPRWNTEDRYSDLQSAQRRCL